MSYTDIKYLNIISPQLQMFKKRDDNLWNFRCPYCGDSKKSKTKARGFVFCKKNKLFFKCHNCDKGASLSNLIKYVDSNIHNDYIMERYNKGVQITAPLPEFKFNAPVFRKKGILKGLQSIKDLPKEHPARIIVEKRKLPPESYFDLYLCESFFKFTNSIIPNKFPTLNGDHPRLFIPFRDEQGEVFAYQGRSFGKEQPKYITIKLDDDKDKVFGLNNVTKEKPVLVVEGPLDSLFLDNCIAVAGASFSKPLSIEGRLMQNGELTIIFDNEPRNREINKQIEKSINLGRNVCLWPDNMKWKDINDMILHGYSKEQIQQIITDNTFSGAAAQLRFAEWRKINA